MDEFIGLSLIDAQKKAADLNFITRVVSLEGKRFIITQDLRTNRLNFTVLNGKIIKCEKY